ncbi:MAG: esterase family protein [Clostridiaceae bacterium]|mgnify:CR=1 FL=1|nr:esterase family protein [Clostridiaceae bacterium]
MKRRIFAILLVATFLAMAIITGCEQNSTSTDAPDASLLTDKATDPAGDESVSSAESTSAPETTIPAETTAEPPSRLIAEEFISANIADNNMMGDSGIRQLFVYLPPNYFESEESYPVVYYFHGFGESAGAFLREAKGFLDNYFNAGEKPFIMVEVPGGGSTVGSFYVNSPASGNWEDFVIDDVIPYVDSNYRTLPQAESRGICGFSMGGFGAMNLALRHPDIFAAVYAMSPGIMKDDALAEAMDTWNGDNSFLRAYARAFAPNLENENYFGDIPAMDGTDADNLIVAKWYSGFGNWSQKLDAYLALETPLRAIGISYGSYDSYTWIPTGCDYFVDLLRENGIEPTFYTSDGGHRLPDNAIQEHLGPFFNENLMWE